MTSFIILIKYFYLIEDTLFILTSY